MGSPLDWKPDACMTVQTTDLAGAVYRSRASPFGFLVSPCII